MKLKINNKKIRMSAKSHFDYPQLARDSGFKLRLYNDGPLNWRTVGNLEVDRLLREKTYEQLDNVLLHLSEAPLGSVLDTNILDSGVTKYFLLSQFAIQYLLFCRKFLDETVQELRESLLVSQKDLLQQKKSLAAANNEVLQLNQKITQLETIREVVYPCHLCAKCFISNDALNIHISKRHNDSNRADEVGAVETPSPTHVVEQKELAFDLEYEISKLKKRISSSEEGLKKTVASPIRRATVRNVATQMTSTMPRIITNCTCARINSKMLNSAGTEMKDVAIQNNLTDTKEQDETCIEVEAVQEQEKQEQHSNVDKEVDYSLTPSSTARQQERKDELLKLQTKIAEFEEWKITQQTNTTETMNEIYSKLADIAQALEETQRQREAEKALLSSEATNLHRRISPSVDDLEKLLSDKVSEISLATAAKLEQVANEMEQSYSGKLAQLELQIRAKCDQTTTSTEEVENEPPLKMNSTKEAVTTVRNLKKSKEMPKVLVKALVHEKQQILHSTPYTESKRSVSVCSNETYVKETDAIEVAKESAATPALDTEVSSEMSSTSSAASDSEESTSTRTSMDDKILNEKTANDEKEEAVLSQETETRKLASPKRRPKKYTRSDARKLANQRLALLGLELKDRTLSKASAQKLAADLAERRNKIKQKHPHFLATRNRIKKFVDKLCSKKLPDNAEALLKNTQPQQPAHKNQKDRLVETSSLKGTSSKLPTPRQVLSAPQSARAQLQGEEDVFKQRLERLLSSPIQRPQPRQLTATKLAVPMPMPRKRVMFSNASLSEDSEDNTQTQAARKQ